MQRIRYRKLNATTDQSVRTLRHPYNGAAYVVRLVKQTPPDPSVEWLIVDVGTDTVCASGRNASRAALHKHLRRALRDLGIPLSEEIHKKI